MYSYKQFAPGNSSNSNRLIKYVAEWNAVYPENANYTCYCIPNKYDKTSLPSNSPSSNSMRIAQILKSQRGGKTEYGNFYLGQPLALNYLGRIEGMSGGSGKPPTNWR